MNLVARRFLNANQVGSQECVYNLLSMHMSDFSRTVVWVNTFPKDERYSLMRDVEQLHNVGNKGPIFNFSNIDHYELRPNIEEFNGLCLADFVAHYDWISLTRYKELTNQGVLFISTRTGAQAKADDQREDEDEIGRINLSSTQTNATDLPDSQGHTVNERFISVKWQNPEKPNSKLETVGYLTVRKLPPKIIRYVRYRFAKDPVNWYREQLMLFVPWRSEEAEINKRTLEELERLFAQKKETIRFNRSKFENKITSRFEEIVQETDQRLEQADQERAALNESIELHAQADQVYDGENEEIRLSQLEERIGFQNQIDFFDPNHDSMRLNAQQIRVMNEQADAQLKEFLYDTPEFMALITSLNREQQIFILNTLERIKRGDTVHLFVSGQGGTGKSRLIQAISAVLNRYFNEEARKRDPEEGDHPRVLILAPYGTTAYLVKGRTIHSALHIAFATNEQDDVVESVEPASATERDNLARIECVIVDEISLVGVNLALKMDRKLREYMDATKKFGGANMIYVGDLYQLPPVLDSWIFASPKDPYSVLYDVTSQGSSPNQLWNTFELFQLTQVMRQQEQLDFAEAIGEAGRRGVLSLNDWQLQMFNSRICDEKKIPEDAVHLFYTNEEKDLYNRIKITEKNSTQPFRQEAIDSARGEGADTWPCNQVLASLLEKVRMNIPGDKQILPNVILLKEECKYMYCTNLSVEDGIVNGTVFFLKKIVYGERLSPRPHSERPVPWVSMPKVNKRIAIRVWAHCPNDEAIGEKQRKWARSQKPDLYLEDSIPTEGNKWFPLKLDTLRIKEKKSKNSFIIERTQFNFVEAEAITIHKSQGSTIEKVAVCLSRPLSQAAFYVAVSRVSKLENLYFFGDVNILNVNYRNMNPQERKKKLDQLLANNKARKEYERMRTHALMPNKWKFLEAARTFTYDKMSFMIHNCTSYNSFNEYINADLGFNDRSDVLLLSGCRNGQRVWPSPKDYIMIHRSWANQTMYKGGQICFVHVRREKEIMFVADNSQSPANSLYSARVKGLANEGHVELALFKCNINTRSSLQPNQDVFHLVHIYRHRNCSIDHVIHELKELLKTAGLVEKIGTNEKEKKSIYTLLSKIYLTGYFGIDFYSAEGFRSGRIVMNKLGIVFNNELSIQPDLVLNEANERPTSTDNDGGFTTWCLSNVFDASEALSPPEQFTSTAIVYESFFSKHKPIRLVVTKVENFGPSSKLF